MLRTKFRTKKYFLVQFFPIFMSICLTLGVFGLMPATQKVHADSDVTMTFTVKGWVDSTSSSRINDETSGVSDTGIVAVMNNYYPKTGRVLGRATNSNENFYIFNTDEIPGSITSITITGSTDDSNYFQYNMYAAVGCESQSNVTESEYGVAGTGSKEGFLWSFTGDEGYTYFKLYSNERFVKGTIGETVITVTYTPKTTDRKLVSIYIDGTASKLQYNVGEEFDPTGLKVMGRYDDILGDTEITSGITWSFEPETLSADTNQVSVTAQFKDFTSEEKIVNNLTVTVPVHVYDILPQGFPSGSPSVMKNGWTNGNSKIVLYNHALYLDDEVLLSDNKILTESDGNYFFIDSVNSKYFSFYMKDGVLEKINLLGFTSSQNGDYFPQPTVADILEKAESDFPTGTSLDVSPDGAWVNSTNTSATLFIYSTGFMFKDWSNPSVQTGTPITSVVTKNGDNYQATYKNGKITFNMSGGKLVSISFEHLEDTYASLDGTYVAPLAVAEIDCPTCHGDGLAQCSECFGLGCSSCNGGNVPCTNCGETGKISFTTLEDAIRAVTYYGKIKLLKDNSEEIEISEEAVFVIDKGSFTFDKSKITAGTGYDVSTREDDTETTFIVTHQKTIASILPEDFPTFSMPLPSNAWENRNCTTSKLYKNVSEGLTFGSLDTFDSFDHILNSSLTKVENGYQLTIDSFIIKFEMISDELISITLSGSAHADVNGVYAPHMHDMEHHEAVAPTCTEDGTVEYWTCPNESGVYFANAEGTETLSSIVASKLGHDMEHHEAVAPTCTKDGNVEYWTCSRESGVYYANEQGTATLTTIVDPKLGHDMTHHTAVAPSCTKDGNVEYWTCSHESGVYYANEQGTATLTTIVDSKLGHDIEHHEAVAPTCTQDGTVEYWTCSRESGVYFANEEGTETLSSIIDSKLGHDMEHHEAVAATCTQDGTVEYWTCSRESGVYFANKEGTATLDSIVDPKIGHHYSGEVLYTWNNNQCTASWHCDHDGCEEVESETVTGVYVKDSDATTESNEKGHYVATFSISEFGTNSTAPNSVEIPDSKLSTKGLSGGAIAGIVIGSVFGLLIIAFAVLYILWKRKNLNVPILSKVLTPAFRFINKLFFKTKLNDVEAKKAENKPIKE